MYRRILPANEYNATGYRRANYRGRVNVRAVCPGTRWTLAVRHPRPLRNTGPSAVRFDSSTAWSRVSVARGNGFGIYARPGQIGYDGGNFRPEGGNNGRVVSKFNRRYVRSPTIYVRFPAGRRLINARALYPSVTQMSSL